MKWDGHLASPHGQVAVPLKNLASGQGPVKGCSVWDLLGSYTSVLILEKSEIQSNNKIDVEIWFHDYLILYLDIIMI